jgi:hypothetical protein
MTTKNILLNQTNVVENTNKSTYTYKFLSPQKFENSSIALNSLQMYYSWYNVNQNLYNNNQFQYMWWDSNGLLNQTFTITIPDGFYSIESLNLFIQSEFLKNGHYINTGAATTSTNIFFFQISSNSTYYAFQINITPMYPRASVPVGYVKGSSSWNYPILQETMKVIINSSNNFKKLVGFNAGIYPPTNQTVLYQALSQSTPVISPITSLVLRCNMARNDLANPNDIIYTFSAGNTFFGDIINEKPNSMYYSKIQDGTYNELKIQFFDQNYQQVNILDSQLLMTLIIKEDPVLN